jgi:hypothetical protein
MTEEVRSYLLGALDVLFAFSLALEKRGVLQRAEIVEMLDQVEVQQVQQEGGSTARGAVVHLLRQAFAMPVAGDQVRAGFRVLPGGRPD